MSVNVTIPGTRGDTRQQWRHNFTFDIFDGNPVPAAEGEKTARLEEALRRSLITHRGCRNINHGG